MVAWRLMALSTACLAIAWRTLGHGLARTCTALLGTSLAVFVLFLQIEFLDAARAKAVQLYDFFDFDVAVVSSFYQLMYGAPSFDRIRLAQAHVDGDVEDVFSLNLRTTRWVSAETGERSSAILIGVDDKPEFVRDRDVRESLRTLRDPGAALIDAFANPDYGSLEVGAKGWIRGVETTVAGRFELGLFFYTDGSLMVANTAFPAIAGRTSRDTSIGLIALKPGADAAAAKRRLATALPDDVQVLTRGELIAQEQAYFVSVKPIGIMFRAGMIIAFVVGAVIVYQVLATQIALRMNEFATLKAMGFGAGFVHGVGIVQALTFAVVAFVIAAAAAHFVFAEVRAIVHLPMTLDRDLAVKVLAAAVVMCLASGYVTLRRLKRADPAELY